MDHDKNQMLTKQEIAERLQVSIDDIGKWAHSCSDWLDVCPTLVDKVHDESDFQIFTLINRFNNQINKDVPHQQRIECIRQELHSSRLAFTIKEKRRIEGNLSKNARWSVVGTICLRYDYEWLRPLRSSVDSIISFGCWASHKWDTCSEPYALLWTLEAEKIVVIDKKSEYIQNAQDWLQTTREQHPYFTDYNLEFVVGDMTQKNLIEAVDTFGENSFNLAYCSSVLYQIENTYKLQVAVNTMARVVKPGGWVIAVESIGLYKEFEKAGLEKVDCLDNSSELAKCYRKPLLAK